MDEPSTIVVEKRPAPPSSKPLSTGMLFLKAFALALLLAAGLLAITALILGGVAWIKLNQFIANSGISRQELSETVKRGWSQPVVATNDRKNILLLGVDTLKTRGNSLPLTDTMMLVSMNVKTGEVHTLPLPRDLWSGEYKTKINALYTYGLERYPNEPERFPREVIEQMTGVPVHHTIVLSMEQVAEIIDLLGGIEVNIDKSFTDNEFPRTDVDVTSEKDPAKLYETVSFEQGKHVLTGERALKYIRSRHSEDEEGTDLARSQRQQQVISAVVTKLRQRAVIFNPKLMGKLYSYYNTNFAKYFSPVEGIATVKQLFPARDKIVIESHGLTIYPEVEDGLIEHPPTKNYDKQWVYIVRDQEQFPAAVKELLAL